METESMGGRPAADTLLCYGINCKGKKQQPRGQFSKRMLKAGDRKCDSCMAAAKAARSAAMTDERPICFGVLCEGRRRPCSEFSANQLDRDQKKCKTCVAA